MPFAGVELLGTEHVGQSDAEGQERAKAYPKHRYRPHARSSHCVVDSSESDGTQERTVTQSTPSATPSRSEADIAANVRVFSEAMRAQRAAESDLGLCVVSTEAPMPAERAGGNGLQEPTAVAASGAAGRKQASGDDSGSSQSQRGRRHRRGQGGAASPSPVSGNVVEAGALYVASSDQPHGGPGCYTSTLLRKGSVATLRCDLERPAAQCIGRVRTQSI